MASLILVTHNNGKFAEASEIAKEYGITLERPGSVEKLELQADTLSEVSMFSAIEAFKELKKPLIVDDSGLFVNVLGGFPGVYSAPIFKQIGLPGILELLLRKEDRRAHFECSVSFYTGKASRSFTGKIDGTIAKEIHGSNGFGFDPIFMPDGYGGKTFGELDVLEKNKVSHRSKAFRAFFEWYNNGKHD